MLLLLGLAWVRNLLRVDSEPDLLMTIGIVFPVGHHGEGNGAGGPTAKLTDGRRLLFEQDLFGRWGWLLLFQLTEFLLPLFLPLRNDLGLEGNGFLGILSGRLALYPVDVRLLE